ncbi:MAG: LacI family DNA-binding transcriptional regulator [Phaeodactylibacter sp.]|nr:LacI family DNA-binding transcriptional regulator [Phaeodactylibacter sp.]
MKRTTIKDNARLTGLSVSAVSRALKDHPDISATTKARVREVAEALNYVPNPNAQSLRTQSSKLIAVILPKANTFFFPELLQGISEVVAQQGYSLLFLQSDNSLLREQELVDYCLQRFTEGVLISLSVESHGVEHLDKLRRAGIPVVLLDKVVENTWYPCVTIDDEAVTFQAVKKIIDKGHRHILGLFDDARLLMSQLRSKGFQRALDTHRLPNQPAQAVMVQKEADIEARLEIGLNQFPETTALFTMSDKLMVRAYQVLNRLGYHIPEDIGLISISDGKAPYYLHPNITHMRHSGAQVGKTATTLLFELDYNETVTAPHRFVEVELVELGSV